MIVAPEGGAIVATAEAPVFPETTDSPGAAIVRVLADRVPDQGPVPEEFFPLARK